MAQHELVRLSPGNRNFSKDLEMGVGTSNSKPGLVALDNADSPDCPHMVFNGFAGTKN